MRRGGFTLVELLVVLAIVAVLTALVLGAIGGVRERGDAVRCVNHLKQLAVANVSYASDHDGYFAPAQEQSNLVRWHGVRTSVDGKFDPTKGPLARYLGKEGRVKECPALRKVLKGSQSFEDGTGGYGYNAVYVGGTPADRYKPAFSGSIMRPSRTLMFADTAFPREEGVQEYAYAEPWQWVDRLGRLRGPLAPSVHFRHSGKANIGWCDGSVTAEAPSEIGKGNLYGGDAAKWKIGWIGTPENNGVWNPSPNE